MGEEAEQEIGSHAAGSTDPKGADWAQAATDAIQVQGRKGLSGSDGTLESLRPI